MEGVWGGRGVCGVKMNVRVLGGGGTVAYSS